MAPLIPIAHFFDNPERALARVSPDRRFLAWLAPRDGRMNVWIRPMDDPSAEPIPVTDDRDRGVLSYFFTRDGRFIVYPKEIGRAHV